MTKYGRGGWNFSITTRMFDYTHPVTGHGYSSTSLHWILINRRANEQMREQERLMRQHVKGVTWEP